MEGQRRAGCSNTHHWLTRGLACSLFGGLAAWPVASAFAAPAVTAAAVAERPRSELTAARPVAALALAPPLAAARPAAPVTLAPGDFGGLLGGLGGTLGDIGGALGGTLGDLGGTLGELGGALGELGGNLNAIFSQFSAGLATLLAELSGEISPTPGTETFSGSIVWAGISRDYLGIRPVNAPAGAPVLLLLHPNGLSPGRMANLTLAGRLAADYGAWVYLPASRGGAWADDPGALFGADDVGFLDALLTREVSAHALDASRIYGAGYSNGGFMIERLACERPALLAGIALVAATLRDSVASRCTGPSRTPTVLFNGTRDPIVPYNGVPTLASATNTAAFWAARNQCVATERSVTNLPDLDRTDGTTVSVSRYTRCVDSVVAQYTINGGGHTWPGTQYANYTLALGPTTGDIDATLELWQQLLPYSR